MLRQNWFHILVALADEDRHGSAIAEDVVEQTRGTRRLWPATLYRTLDVMVEEGLIVELKGAAHPDGESHRRRYYRITDEGRTALGDSVRLLESFAGVARERLGEAGA